MAIRLRNAICFRLRAWRIRTNTLRTVWLNRRAWDCVCSWNGLVGVGHRGPPVQSCRDNDAAAVNTLRQGAGEVPTSGLEYVPACPRGVWLNASTC